MKVANAELIDFLEEHKNEIIEKWTSNLVGYSVVDDGEKEYKNEHAFFQLLFENIKYNYLDYDRIQLLAQKIASECITKEMKIGEFVTYLNNGRNEIFKCLHLLNLTIDEIQDPINKINECYSELLSTAVISYSDLKSKINADQERLISETHKDRLTILGRMTASFVHECRNPLTAVMGFMQLLKSEQPDLKYMEIIQRELEQLEFRISQFLLLSKKEVVGKNKQQFSIKQLLIEVVDFLYPSIADSNIDVAVSLDDVDYYGYRDEFKQVFVNIIFNSIDALTQTAGTRKVLIKLKKNNDGIFIQISNNGPKIPDESMKVIFEPFVTTKKMGTGLGLFVCKEIIKKHQGNIFCESSDTLTTFTIRLKEE